MRTSRPRSGTRAIHVRKFGINGVDRVGHVVTSNDVSECLSRLLDKDEAKRRALCGHLAGRSIGIAGRGRLCHPSDDGLIVIPMTCS